MTQIGNFTSSATGFEGRLHTLLIDVPLSFVAAEPSDAKHAPDWRIYLGGSDAGLEVGAGWNHTGEKAGAYVSVQIDCPGLTQPIRANLFRSASDDGQHILLWNRSQRRRERS